MLLLGAQLTDLDVQTWFQYLLIESDGFAKPFQRFSAHKPPRVNVAACFLSTMIRFALPAMALLAGMIPLLTVLFP